MTQLVPTGLALLLAATSGSTGRTLAVVDVHSPPSMMGIAAQVTQAILSAAREQGYQVIAPETLRAELGAKTYEELQKCGGQPICVATRLGRSGAERIVLGTLSRDEKNYLVRLWLLDVGAQSVVAEVDRPILIASRRLMQDVNAAVPGLLRGEREARGRLTVSVNVRGPEVLVDGLPRGTAPLTLELKPGKHEIRVEKRRYLPVDRLVTIEANQTTTEEVRLLLKPGEQPEEDAPAPAVAREAGAGGGWKVPTGVWVAAGVAAAAGGAGAYFGLTARDLERRLEQGYDPDRDLYQGTRQQALTARQQALWANVSFAAAGVALATGAVLMLLSGGEEPTAGLTPMAAGDRAGVLIQGRF